MAYPEAADLPAKRDHLDREDRERLLRFDLLVADSRFDEAQEIVEDLWLEATDAHKPLYQGLSNALTAVCARERCQIRGARQIAHRSRSMLASFPRSALAIDLDALLDSVDYFLERGHGPILLLKQGEQRRR